MKMFLVALVAGLIGGGAAIGVVALDLIPRARTGEVGKTAGPLNLGEERSSATPRDYESEITSLKHQVEALEVRLSQSGDKTVSSDSDRIAALEKQIEGMNKALVRPSHKADNGGESVDVAPSPNVTPEFDSAVREVLTRVQEENAEQRRLDRQAERLQQLEAQKAQIAEFIPTLVKNQAANLGVDEAVIPDVSAALVAHAQYRAEITSEMQGLRIDDQEVDTEAYKLKLEGLDQTTVAALSSYVDQATAERLVSTVSRGGRNNRDNPRQGRR